MDNFIDYFFLVFFLIFCILFTLGIRSPKKRLPEEKGKTPILEEICGARINSMNYTWPFVRHSIYQDFIVIKCIGSSYLIPRSNFSFDAGSSVYSLGVVYKSPKLIGHEVKIWTTLKRKVINELESA